MTAIELLLFLFLRKSVSGRHRAEDMSGYLGFFAGLSGLSGIGNAPSDIEVFFGCTTSVQ